MARTHLSGDGKCSPAWKPGGTNSSEWRRQGVVGVLPPAFLTTAKASKLSRRQKWEYGEKCHPEASQETSNRGPGQSHFLRFPILQIRKMPKPN